MARSSKLPPGIRKISDGLYEVSVSAGVDPARSTEDRKVYRRKWERVHGSLTDAKHRQQELAVEARQGRHGGTSATLNDLLDAWLRELERLRKAPSTISSYRNIARRYIRPTLGTVKVKDVDPRLLADHLAALSERGLAPNSVRLVHATLSSAFSQAMVWGWVESHPVKEKVRAPSIQNKRPTIPTVDEVRRLLEAAQRSNRPEFAAAIWLSATTGVRRGELCGLQVSDFDFDRGRMQVERALSGETVWTTKNRRWREVALDLATVAVVQGHIASMAARATSVGTTWAKDGYLFSDTPRGDHPWNPHLVTDSFRKLTTDLGLRHLTFHSLRKFMESRALDLGFSVTEVAHRAGHDPAVLMRFYAGAVDETGKLLAEGVASLLAPEGQ